MQHTAETIALEPCVRVAAKRPDLIESELEVCGERATSSPGRAPAKGPARLAHARAGAHQPPTARIRRTRRPGVSSLHHQQRPEEGPFLR